MEHFRRVYVLVKCCPQEHSPFGNRPFDVLLGHVLVHGVPHYPLLSSVKVYDVLQMLIDIAPPQVLLGHMLGEGGVQRSTACFATTILSMTGFGPYVHAILNPGTSVLEKVPR